MHLLILCSLIFLPIVGHATTALEIAKAMLIAGNTESSSTSQVTHEPFVGFAQISMGRPKNIGLSNSVLHLFTEQAEKPKIGYFITAKDQDDTRVYFSLKEEMTKHLGLIQLMQEEDDTPDTTPYELQIPETLKQVTVNGVRMLLQLSQRRVKSPADAKDWCSYRLNPFGTPSSEQEYAELLHAAHFLDETGGLRESLLDFSDKGVDFIMNFFNVHQKFHLPIDILHLARVSLSGHAQQLRSNREDLLPALKLMQKVETSSVDMMAEMRELWEIERLWHAEEQAKRLSRMLNLLLREI